LNDHSSIIGGFCENPFRCFNCISNLIERNDDFINKFIFDKFLPEYITKLVLEIPPLVSNINDFYDFDGVDTIIFNIFKQIDRSVIHDLRNGEVVIRVLLKKDIVFTFPKLVIEIFFLKKLTETTIRTLDDTIKTLLLVFTNGCGTIEVLKDIDKGLVLRNFDINYLIGYSLLRKDDYTLLSSIPETKIDEMNELLKVYSIRVKVGDIINNPLMSIFPSTNQLNIWTETPN
jgi:hypothetical protein